MTFFLKVSNTSAYVYLLLCIIMYVTISKKILICIGE